MDEGMNVGLQNSIVAELTTELKDDPDFSSEILTSKVISAIREVKMRRNYSATSYTDKQIESDLDNYYSVIKRVALYDYNQRGVEGQVSHGENGTSRTWENREKLFYGVHAFVKVF